MKFSTVTIGLLALISPLSVSAAWSKEDREIFRVRDEILTHEGADVTFYNFLGVAPSANQDDINKAYKKKTKALHPDKVKQQLAAERATGGKGKGKKPGVKVTKPPTKSEVNAAIKAAGERQARLSIVVNILRGEGRARYDHFLSNGFPVWKGTGYYYSRYRPGLGTVLFGCLLAFGGAFHYVALYMSWRRQREFIVRYIEFARRAAWGDSTGIPGVDAAAVLPPPPPPPAADDEAQPLMAMNRKQRRMQEQNARRESAKESKRSGRKGASRSGGSGSATPVPQTQPAEETGGPVGAKKRVVAQNGKILVVDSLRNVYLEQADADGNIEEFLLDPEEIPQPTIRDTALVRLPVWVFNTIKYRISGKKASDDEDDEDFVEEIVEELADDDESDPNPQRTPSTDSADDFELLEKTEDLTRSKTSSSQAGSGKAKKRNKKR